MQQGNLLSLSSEKKWEHMSQRAAIVMPHFTVTWWKVTQEQSRGKNISKSSVPAGALGLLDLIADISFSGALLWFFFFFYLSLELLRWHRDFFILIVIWRVVVLMPLCQVGCVMMCPPAMCCDVIAGGRSHSERGDRLHIKPFVCLCFCRAAVSNGTLLFGSQKI